MINFFKGSIPRHFYFYKFPCSEFYPDQGPEFWKKFREIRPEKVTHFSFNFFLSEKFAGNFSGPCVAKF